LYCSFNSKLETAVRKLVTVKEDTNNNNIINTDEVEVAEVVVMRPSTQTSVT
jgi:hypothetical protein